MKIPEVTANEMREIDRRAIEEYNIPALSLMENAGQRSAEFIIRHYPQSERITILAGKGNNGGDGLVAALSLQKSGKTVEIVLADDKLKGIPLLQLQRVEELKIPVLHSFRQKPDIIIDALLGYSSRGIPRGRIGELITESKKYPAEIISLDIPSGFDLDTGTFYSPSFQGAVVLTFGLPKKYMTGNPGIKKLYLIDIGFPQPIFQSFGIQYPEDIFARGSFNAEIF